MGLWFPMTDGRYEAFVVYVAFGGVERMRPMVVVLVLMR